MVPCHSVRRDDVGSSDVISNHWNVPVFGCCWWRHFSVVGDSMFNENKVTVRHKETGFPGVSRRRLGVGL
jgi:hypothetical protein